MSEKDKILDNYNALFEKDENGKALSEEAFLDRLIALESSGKTRLFRTLLGGKSKEEVRDYLNSKGRDDWEKIVSKEYLGKSMTIVDIINQYSKMIKETFKTKHMKEALKELGIQSEKLDGVILPSEGDQRIKSGNLEGGEEYEEKKRLKFKEYQEKIETLFSDILNVDNGIYLGDLEVFEGKNEKDMVRYTSYIAVKIPKLEKTIFINDREGESTFVCDRLVPEHDMTTKSKKKFREELGDAFHSVSYSENKKEQWKLDMIDLIFGPENGTQKYIRDTLIDENGELTEKGKEWFRLNVTARKAFKLQDGISYVDIARKFGFIVEEKDELVKDEKYVELTEKIFGVNKKKEDQRKIRIELMDEKGELTEKGKEWFALNVRARATFKLQDGISYVDIARKFGFTEKGIELYKDEKYEELTEMIFGLDKKNEYEKQITLEKQMEIREELVDEKGELTAKGREWFSLNTNTRPKFKLLDGRTYVDIARNFGFIVEERDELVKDEKYEELTEMIFGVDKKNEYEEQIKKEDQWKIRTELMDEKGELTEKGKEWFSLNTNTRPKFKLSDGRGYIDIARKFGFKEGKYELIKDEQYGELTEKIFGLDKKNEYERQIMLEKQMEIREELVDEKGELTAKGREWFSLNTNTRPKFKLSDGKTYVDIARNFGFKEGQHELIRDEQYGELTEKIFGLDKKNEYENQIILEKQVEIREELVDEKGELTAKGREWFSLKTATRKKFKLLDGRGYIDIARKFLFKEKADELYKDVVFYKLSMAIFGEDNENVKILKEKLDKQKNKS